MIPRNSTKCQQEILVGIFFIQTTQNEYVPFINAMTSLNDCQKQIFNFQSQANLSFYWKSSENLFGFLTFIWAYSLHNWPLPTATCYLHLHWMLISSPQSFKCEKGKLFVCVHLHPMIPSMDNALLHTSHFIKGLPWVYMYFFIEY